MKKTKAGMSFSTFCKEGDYFKKCQTVHAKQGVPPKPVPFDCVWSLVLRTPYSLHLPEILPLNDALKAIFCGQFTYLEMWEDTTALRRNLRSHRAMYNMDRFALIWSFSCTPPARAL